MSEELKVLANIAAIRRHIDYIDNVSYNDIDKQSLKLLDSKKRKLDCMFTDYLIANFEAIEESLFGSPNPDGHEEELNTVNDS